MKCTVMDMSSATVFPLAASKSAFLSFLVFSCTLILDVMSLPLSLSHPLLLCILQVMDRNRWIRNLGRKLKVYTYNSLVPCSILLSLSTYELPPTPSHRYFLTLSGPTEDFFTVSAIDAIASSSV